MDVETRGWPQVSVRASRSKTIFLRQGHSLSLQLSTCGSSYPCRISHTLTVTATSGFSEFGVESNSESLSPD